MSATLVIALPRARGAHRKPAAAGYYACLGVIAAAGASILLFGAEAMLAPRSGCHAVPMHLGWPNSHCSHSWAKWRQP
jgi:predicted phage tail protein